LFSNSNQSMCGRWREMKEECRKSGGVWIT